VDSQAVDTAQEAGLWQRYRQGADEDAKSRLLAIHLPYARVVAGSYYARRFHNEIPFEEFLQCAHLGMLEALPRFDPARGVLFRTFAARRMHGAILDGLERFTEKQQQIAVRQRLRTERVAEIRGAAGEPGAASEGLSDPQQLLRYVSEVGIGLALCWLLEGTGMVEDAGAFHSAPFYQPAALREVRQVLLGAVEALPAQERAVIRGHYLQELPFERIATSMELTKGRISQIHKQALGRLRQAVREYGDWNVRL
jgi:RNA polymerase sigma factor for flagellar operon FliA